MEEQDNKKDYEEGEIKEEIDPITKHYSEEFGIKMVNLLKYKGDLISLILRGHLTVEYYLDRLIMVCLPRGDIIVRNLSFANKLQLVKSLDRLSKNILDSISNLNSIRNACSHDLNYKVSEKDLDRLGAPILDEYLGIKIKERGIFDRLIALLNVLIMDISIKYQNAAEGRLEESKQEIDEN